MTTPQDDGRRARHLAMLVAVVLGTVGVAAVAWGVLAQPSTPPTPPAVQPDVSSERSQPSPDRRGEAAKGSRRSLPALDYSEPASIAIPSIGVKSPLVDLELDSQGVMETPEPVEVAGWFTPSPPPGVGGATVIAGHVTWDQQPTVFFRLGDLEPGDRVAVTRDDGVTVTYDVTRIGTFPKDSFPTDEVYAQPGRSELRLITCGGRYDDAANRYPDNVIVWARATAVSKG